jgi:5-methyltetrahydropteroyltriglutamate--homocysteine methyltransferase
MKKMTEVLVHLSGNLPRSEELFGVLRRYGRGKATWEEVRSAALAETSEWIRLERELGFDLLTDPMLLWHDHFRPFAERWSGLEVDGLARWFDNNLFYRVPVFREKPSGHGDVLAEYIFAEALRGRSAKLILPEPFTMVMLSNRRLQVSPEELAVDVARLLAEEVTHFLKHTGLQVELLQLSAPYVVSRRLNPAEVDAVTESIKVLKRKTGLRVQLHTFFYSLGNARGWIEDAGADVVGFDATVTSLDEVLDSGLRGEVAVGIVDSRSSRVERPDEVMGALRALADAGFTRIHLTTTTDLEYVPPEVARSKLGALREIREAFLGRGG